MAKILQGIGVEAISGTIGGTTFQKWRGLLIARGKPTPSNPSTPRQTRIRSIVSTISKAWRDVLTPGQRIAWDQFADVFPWFDVFGRSLSLRGISLFLKINTVLLDHNRVMRITPPPAVEPPELTPSVIVPSVGSLVVSVPQIDADLLTAQETFLDMWVAGGFLTAVDDDAERVITLIESRALPQGRKAQKSDFRHALYANDKPIPVAPEVPEDGEITILPPLGDTRNVVLRVQRYNKYGRYSVPVVYSGIITRPA